MKSGLARLLNQGSPVPYAPRAASGNMTGLISRTGNETFLRQMGASGTLFQIVSLLSGGTSRAEWRLYRKTVDSRRRYSTGETGSDQRTEVLQHQALSVLSKPASFTSGRFEIPAFTRASLFELGQTYQELTGECPFVVVFDPRASFPVGLWPVRPDRLEHVPDPGNFLKGWVYNGPGGERVPLMPHEVILEKLPNPWDVYRGLGPVQSLMIDLQAAQYSARWNLNFFLNDASPGGVVEIPDSLDDTEFDDFQKHWRESHQGVMGAHRVAMLEAGAKWVNTQMSLRDMDFANLRGVSREIVREAYGMHGAMLGLSEDINRANAQTAEEVFASWKIVPRLDRRKETLNSLFLPLFGSAGAGVEFGYVSPKPANREEDNSELTAKANAANILVAAGWDPGDVLEVVGLPAMGFGAQAQPEPGPADQVMADQVMAAMRGRAAGWDLSVYKPDLSVYRHANGHAKAGV